MSSSVLIVVRDLFSNAIKRAFPKAGAVETKILPSQPQFGDYQCSNAMELFSAFKSEP